MAQIRQSFVLAMTAFTLVPLAAVSAETKALKLYWSPGRGDNYTGATAQGEQAALAAGYQLARVEGYIYPTQQAGAVGIERLGKVGPLLPPVPKGGLLPPRSDTLPQEKAEGSTSPRVKPSGTMLPNPIGKPAW